MKFLICLFVAAQWALAEYEYTTFKDGKIVKIKANDKPKYSASLNTDEVLYIKSKDLIVERSDPKAEIPFDRFKNLCGKKDPIGCYVIALYFEDLGNIEEAAAYFDLACEYGDTNCCLYGGSHYHYRLKDYKKALEAFKKACNKKEAAACFNMGHDYRELGDEVGAMHGFSLACTMGYANGCIEKAHSLKEKSKDPKDLQESYNIFMGFCAKGDQKSCDQAENASNKLKAVKAAK